MTTQQNTRPARLYRSREDRVIAGIGGGLGKYLGIDPVLVRIGIVVLCLIGGGGILAYLIAWLVIPEEPYPGAAGDEALAGEEAGRRRPVAGARVVVGVALIAIGLGFLLDWMIPDFTRIFWPLIVIGAGGALLYYGTRR
jgi:phage shock protein C